MRPTPAPSPGLDPEACLPVVPEAPAPLTDGGSDRLVTVAPAAAVVRPSATLLAARQLLEEADPHARRLVAGRDRASRSRRRRELRGLVGERRALRDRRG